MKKLMLASFATLLLNATLVALNFTGVGHAYQITQAWIPQTGQLVTAAQIQSDLGPIYSVINGGIDNTNIGSAGVYASQTICSTVATCTFGNAIPLTVLNGVVAQPTPTATPAGVPNGSLLSQGGVIVSDNASPATPLPSASPGDAVAMQNQGCGRFWLGGNSGGNIDFGCTSSGKFSFNGGAIGNAIFNGTVTNSGTISGGTYSSPTFSGTVTNPDSSTWTSSGLSSLTVSSGVVNANNGFNNSIVGTNIRATGGPPVTTMSILISNQTGSSGEVSFGNGSSTTAFGYVTSGGYTPPSSSKIKYSIEPYSFDPLKLIERTHYASYCRRDGLKPPYPPCSDADRIYEIIADDTPWPIATRDHDGFQTTQALAIAMAAIKEQQREINELRDQLRRRR